MQLQLGCGKHPIPGFINTDIRSFPGVDKIVDLEKPLPFPDNSIDYVYARAVIEHVNNIQQLMKELWRVTKNGSKIDILVPHPSNIFTFRDWTHVKFFTLHTFDFYVDGTPFDFYYPDVRFKILERKLEFTSGRFKFLNFISWFLNRSFFFQDLWERFCWLLPMDSMYFTLQTIKENKNGKSN